MRGQPTHLSRFKLVKKLLLVSRKGLQQQHEQVQVWLSLHVKKFYVLWRFSSTLNQIFLQLQLFKTSNQGVKHFSVVINVSFYVSQIFLNFKKKIDLISTTAIKNLLLIEFKPVKRGEILSFDYKTFFYFIFILFFSINSSIDIRLFTHILECFQCASIFVFSYSTIILILY